MAKTAAIRSMKPLAEPSLATAAANVAAAASACDYLGPARVVGGGPTQVDVELPTGRRVSARLALAFAYAARVDDTMLVIGGPSGHYVIGVLSGAGVSVLEVPGDIELRAGGELRLAAERGVRVDAPVVEMRSAKLDVIADTVVHTFTSLRQRVRELLSIHAGSAHTVVEQTAYSQAENVTMLTKDKMTLNGKAIHLG
jgi:hypothetical protein